MLSKKINLLIIFCILFTQCYYIGRKDKDDLNSNNAFILLLALNSAYHKPCTEDRNAHKLISIGFIESNTVTKGFMKCYQLDSPIVTKFSVDLNTISGDSDLYISSENEVPIGTKGYWPLKSKNFGLTKEILNSEFPYPGSKIIGIYGFLESNYTLTVY